MRRRAEPLEHQSQAVFIAWWSYFCHIVKLDERLLYAVPNAGAGAQRGQAGKMKAEVELTSPNATRLPRRSAIDRTGAAARTKSPE